MSPPPVDPALQVLGDVLSSAHDPSRATRPCVRLWPAAKRGTDIALASLLLLAVVPLLLIVAMAIKLDSPGPVLYRARRIGFRGTQFGMLKFRKMYRDATGGPLTTGSDPRLTRVGAVLTRTRLDELPQLWDVLRGRMSIIGPRPEDPRFVALHPSDYERILAVRPGITGITQLAFADERKLLDEHDPVRDYVTRLLPHKVALDRLYAEHQRPGLDLAVLRWTLVSVLLRRPVAVHRSSGRITLRSRPAETAETVSPVSRAEQTA
jgi:lipopolysaccharide/colanic/teichoic acid biosynthesis glycosyltransferase